MTREEASELALSKICSTRCLILELITGMGKSKIAIDLANHICDRVYDMFESPTSILILVAKRVHKQNWEKEIKKWGGIKSDYITIECYESLHKYQNTRFDLVIADECQHLSERRLEILDTINIEEAFIGLSATIKKSMKEYFISKYKAEIIKCDLKDAIADNVLPEPKVYLLPLELDKTSYIYRIKKFGKIIVTSQKGYYDDLSSLVEWYKRKFYTTRNERIKNLWLSTAGKRLKWCAEQKEYTVKSILDKFKNYRTLTFCCSIEQAEHLGKYNITSKNKDSIENLNMFNESKIKHITACSILNEGVNLTNCRIGIFCNLNSSEIITRQRIGRLLRHKSPVIIVPYYRFTREEELVNKMIEEYNKESVIVINNINEIKL